MTDLFWETFKSIMNNYDMSDYRDTALQRGICVRCEELVENVYDKLYQKTAICPDCREDEDLVDV